MPYESSAQSRLLVKGGKIVNHDNSFLADIYIEDGIIKQIGQNLVIPGGSRTIDARGLLILPGGVDASTHLNFFYRGCLSSDNFYDGTKAALAGGTTTVIDVLFITEKQGESSSILEEFDKRKAGANTQSACDYAIQVGVTAWSSSVSSQMEELAKKRGVNCFWISTGLIDYSLTDSDLYKVMVKCKQLGAIVKVQPGNSALAKDRAKEIFEQGIHGPEGFHQATKEIDEESVFRIATIASQTGCPTIIAPVMSCEAVDMVSQAKRMGAPVFTETMTAAIGCSADHYYNRCWRHAAGHVTFGPPLSGSGEAANQKLVHRLECGDIDLISSDHCTFGSDRKAQGKDDFRLIPGGLNGIEERLCVLWDHGVAKGLMDPCRFVAVTSTNAAKLHNLFPKKGTVAVGSDADIVLWDTKRPKTFSAQSHNSKCDFSVFEGVKCKASPSYVICQGCVVMDDGQLKVSQGAGRYLSSPCENERLYFKIRQREQNFAVVNGSVEESPASNEEVPQKPVTPRSEPTQESTTPRSISPDLNTSSGIRYKTKSGVRNMQESSFSLSGQQIDDNVRQRSGVRSQAPPGGKSSGIW